MPKSPAKSRDDQSGSKISKQKSDGHPGPLAQMTSSRNSQFQWKMTKEVETDRRRQVWGGNRCQWNSGTVEQWNIGTVVTGATSISAVHCSGHYFLCPAVTGGTTVASTCGSSRSTSSFSFAPSSPFCLLHIRPSFLDDKNHPTEGRQRIDYM